MHHTTANHTLERSLIVTLVGLGGYGCQLAFTHLLTHNLSLPLYGDFAVAWQTLQLVSQILAFGTPASTQRFVSQYARSKERHKIHAVVSWVFSILIQSSIALVLVYLLFWMMATVTHLTSYHRFDQYHLAMFVAIFAPAMAISSVLNSLLRANGYSFLATVINTVVYYGTQLSVIAVFINAFLPSTILHLSIMIFTILSLLLLINFIISIWVPENEILQILSTSRSPKHFYDSSWLSISQTACLNQILFTFTMTMDLYILEIFTPSEHDVGIFCICRICVNILVSLHRAINNQSITQIMNISSMSAAELESIQKSLDTFNGFKLSLVVLSTVGAWYFSDNILSFFNIHSSSYYLVVPWMAINIFIGDDQYQYTFLLGKKELVYVNTTQTLSMVIIFVAALVLVFPYGIYGVVFAGTLSRAFSTVLLTYRCRQLSSIRFKLFV